MRKHVFRGMPFHEAWADVVEVASPAFGQAVAQSVFELPIAQGLATCTAACWLLLVGTAKSRGVGCGPDIGDLLTIGTAGASGFKPSKIP